MATSNPQEYLALVAELENLKSKFTALELENQRLLEDLQKVSMENQQIHEEFTRRVQQLESTIVALQQVKVEGQGVIRSPKLAFQLNSWVKSSFSRIYQSSAIGNSDASHAIFDGFLSSWVSRHFIDWDDIVMVCSIARSKFSSS
jgi:pyruvate-formate lyase